MISEHCYREILICNRCGCEIHNAHFNTKKCRTCVREYDNERRRGVKRTLALRNRLSKWYKDDYKLRKYGLTKDDETAILTKQENKCAICSMELGLNGKRVHIDHNHTTGHVRGILCGKCNLGLGHFNDNLKLIENAAKYLKETDIDPDTGIRSCDA